MSGPKVNINLTNFIFYCAINQLNRYNTVAHLMRRIVNVLFFLPTEQKMPLYDFECEPCAYYTEIRQAHDAPSIHKCPVCEEQTLTKVFINAPHTFVRGERKTIGQLAEHNWNQMGAYEKEDRKLKDGLDDAVKKKKKEKRERNHKLTSMSKEMQMKWIREGD
jgi:putative FmdB family regulatory protein